MKAARIILLLLVPCFFLSMQCKKEKANCHYTLWLNNQTDKDVYAYYSFDYPDTSITFQNPMMSAYSFIGANQRKTFYVQNRCLEKYIENPMQNYTPKDTLCIFVFDAALIQSTSWEQVRQNYQVLKRYDYSLDELKNTNFSIDFP